MIFNLEHISVEKFYQLEEQAAEGYLELARYVLAKPMFLGREPKDLGALEYGQVSIIKRSLVKPSFKSLGTVFEMVFGTSPYLQKRADIVDYFYALKWLTEEIQKMIEKERKFLTGRPDPLLEAAGAERLSIFGELPALKLLGTQYGKSPEEISKWSYNLVFTLLYMDTIEAEVRTDYDKLKNKPKA